MVLSWYSWNWPLTKRSTRLDLPTADSPNSTSLNWQILLLAVVPLVRAGPPRPAILQCWKLGKRRRSWGKRVYGWLQAWAYYRGADEVKMDVGKFRLVGRFTGRRGGLTSGELQNTTNLVKLYSKQNRFLLKTTTVIVKPVNTSSIKSPQNKITPCSCKRFDIRKIIEESSDTFSLTQND